MTNRHRILASALLVVLIIVALLVLTPRADARPLPVWNSTSTTAVRPVLPSVQPVSSSATRCRLVMTIVRTDRGIRVIRNRSFVRSAGKQHIVRSKNVTYIYRCTSKVVTR